ncbi:CYTH domain-containing protein [Oceanisphaera avium]|uniref:CYTH domain-containing protein n=1 Tax=Oceanisphaera avium TaxID=1903694 RepID=A0A1Y0CY16_9GAMM|nr:CYTH domain-containing protein [Oceanisphaera avium]ART80148.1 hypothetical protein CBP12_08305 [Oceanisphaera avium]
MNTEIELKFLVSAKRMALLAEQLMQFEVCQHDHTFLSNTYFDTPNLDLSALKAGLRIREQNGQLEQTLKFAGHQVGGLHQRPEYNLALATPWPELGAFARTVWPPDVKPALIQAQLAPLFSTDFMRQRWLINYHHTQIELALDVGEVKAANAEPQPIQELELELVSGDVAQVFALAKQLATLDGLRLSDVSKAQRGYRLAKLAPPLLPNTYPLAAIPDTREELLKSLNQAIKHWQYHEQGWQENALDSPDSAWLNQWRLAVQWVHQALVALQHSAFLDELLWLQNKLAKAQALTALSESARYAHLMLALSEYLYNQTAVG